VDIGELFYCLYRQDQTLLSVCNGGGFKRFIADMTDKVLANIVHVVYYFSNFYHVILATSIPAVNILRVCVDESKCSKDE